MSAPAPLPVDSPSTSRRGWYRWVICGLLFLATTISYVDRQVVAILEPVLKVELHWNDVTYGRIVGAFQLAYAIGYLGAGRLMDRLGVRLGFALAVAVWSIASAGHGLARAAWQFFAARFALGLAEGGNFPGAVKSVGEWFPRRERALATGLFNAGSNVGAMITPLLVPWLCDHWGWPAAFYFTGSLGLAWVVLWLPLYNRPEASRFVGEAELAHIRSDPPEPKAKIAWRRLLRRRQTWAAVAGMFGTAPIWWFYLYWLPKFLHENYGLSWKEFGWPLVVFYLLTDVGSIGGGWISSALLKRGWSVNAARKTAMLICALCVTPVVTAPSLGSMWGAILVIGLAASAHQGFSANLFTMMSDTVPREAVGSVVGIAGCAGALGGLIAAESIGQTLERTHSYQLPFAVAACGYLVVLLVIHLLLPRLERMQLDGDVS